MKWIAILLLAVAGGVRGDGPPSAGTVSRALGGESHGWIAMPLTGGEDRAVIVHIPPRRDWSRADSAGDLDDGSIRTALRLRQMPERLAAWEGDLWIAFAPEGGERQRRILRMSVERSIGGAWASPEAEGRLPSMASLPGDKDLLAFVGTARGPVALFRASDGPALSLLLGTESGWSDVALPAEFAGGWDVRAAAAGRLDLAPGLTGPMLLATEPGRCTAWSARFTKGAALDWTKSEYTLPEQSGQLMRPVVVAGQLVYVGRDGPAADVWNPMRNECRRLGRVGDIRGDLGVVPLDGLGRVALLCDEPLPSAAATRTTRIVEVSAFSGAALFDGPANVRGPVSAMELKLLAIILVGVMAVVLIVVLRPEDAGAGVSLPPGLALAEPGRRIAAGAIDLAVAVLIASWARRVSPIDLLSPAVFLTDPAGLATVLLVVGGGVVHSTLGEWLFGRTAGKALTGCATMAVMPAKADASGVLQPALARPSLWRAFMRNLVRWTLAPVAIAGLNGADHRHRGDTAAGTVVVVRISEQPEKG